MLYSNYQLVFYQKAGHSSSPVLEYLAQFPEKERAKIDGYLNFLIAREGRLAEPYAKHIDGKIWELRIRYGHNHHRIFYSLLPDKRIIALSAFLKKTRKTPTAELEKAQYYYFNFISLL